jgi:hypothetical protein
VFVIKHSTEANSGSVLQVQHMRTCRCLSEHMQVCLNVGSCTSERERERERESTLRKAQAMLGSSYRNRRAFEVEILVTFVEF